MYTSTTNSIIVKLPFCRVKGVYVFLLPTQINKKKLSRFNLISNFIRLKLVNCNDQLYVVVNAIYVFLVSLIFQFFHSVKPCTIDCLSKVVPYNL